MCTINPQFVQPQNMLLWWIDCRFCFSIWMAPFPINDPWQAIYSQYNSTKMQLSHHNVHCTKLNTGKQTCWPSAWSLIVHCKPQPHLTAIKNKQPSAIKIFSKSLRLMCPHYYCCCCCYYYYYWQMPINLLCSSSLPGELPMKVHPIVL